VLKEQNAEMKAEMPEAGEAETSGTCQSGQRRIVQTSVAENPCPELSRLMESVVERGNMTRAYKRVVRNKGASGIDGMSVKALKPYLEKHWLQIKQQLLRGVYKPKMTRIVYIPKPSGGVRQLGIPTVLDRLIQQALQQVLSPIFEETFSETSYGFRPNKSAHQAIVRSKKYQQEGRRVLVDIDLKQFFDEVNHDRLISKIRTKVSDQRVLKLINRCLKSGIMIDGLKQRREKGTPQGSPLSPLLSNIVLDELDKELESRGHKFCRYADDCNIYVGSEKAGKRIMQSIKKFIEGKLRLKVNEEKSLVSRPSLRKFLGYSFTNQKELKIRIPRETVIRLHKKLKEAFRKGKGRNLGRFIKETLNPILIGWINYFKLAEVKTFAVELDKWIRYRLRIIKWKQWKKPKRRYKELIKAGLTEEQARKEAYNGRKSCFNAGSRSMNQAIKKAYFIKLGLVSLTDKLREIRKTLNLETAVYGTVRTVV
jgi:RNA-directed DNA polymerase